MRPVNAVAAAVAGLAKINFRKRTAHAPDEIAIHRGQCAFACRKDSAMTTDTRAAT